MGSEILNSTFYYFGVFVVKQFRVCQYVLGERIQ